MAAIYFTRTGDDGSTGVFGGRVRKDSTLIDVIGNIDELNSSIGIVLQHISDKSLQDWLYEVQNDLFKIGAYMAFLQNKQGKKVCVDKSDIEKLEGHIKSLSEALPEQHQFVIPSGAHAAPFLHFARAVARRAERSMVSLTNEYDVDKDAIAYANRLSSFLFVAALYVNHSAGKEERHPTY